MLAATAVEAPTMAVSCWTQLRMAMTMLDAAAAEALATAVSSCKQLT